MKTIIDALEKNEVINKELAGYRILTGLISEYAALALNVFRDQQSNYDKLLKKSLPDSVELGQDSLYINLLAVCSYVASLSDSKAMQIYHRLHQRKRLVFPSYDEC